MRILLTGANGNFGCELIAQSKHEIVPLNRDGWNTLENKFSLGIDVILHAASDLRSRADSDPIKLVDSNIVSTARLLAAAKQYCIPRFIFLSSCAVYGEDMRTNENESCHPISVNGIGKLLNEKIIAEFCVSHGIKYEILRVFNMYGGCDHFSIVNHIKRALENGTQFTLNNGGIAQRDFIHVSDVARVILQLLDISNPYTHLNIGTGVATKIATLIELVMERFPSLNVEHAQVDEAEYSRADIARLLNLVEGGFIRVEDYLMHDFMPNLTP